MAPKNYTMLRERDPRVEYYHTEEPVPGTKTTFAVWAPPPSLWGLPSSKLPVLLFQSGHHHDSAGHTPFLEKVAAEGFLVIAPDRSDDQACGACGIIGFLSMVSCGAMAVDGSNLGLALAYAQNPKNKWMDRADLSKVTVAGFSMGAAEAIATQARFPQETKAMVLLSPSVLMPLANPIGWNCCCYPCAGGSCFLCSDTPVTPCGQGAALRAAAVPALVVVGENDGVAAGAHRAADILAEKGHGTLVTLKEEVLDLSTPITNETSSWGLFLAAGCYGSPFFGFRRHFALADDVNGETSTPVATFLKAVHAGGKPLVATEKMFDGKLNSRAPYSICQPFPLFHSCFES